MKEIPEKFTCCQCELPDFDEGICMKCDKPDGESWGLGPIQLKVNEIIDYLRDYKAHSGPCV